MKICWFAQKRSTQGQFGELLLRDPFLGRALFENAELVLLDEPFASLDRSTRIQMADLCGDLLAHKTVLLVTHDPRDASDWLHHTMVLTERELKGPYHLDDFSNDRALIEALEGDL